MSAGGRTRGAPTEVLAEQGSVERERSGVSADDETAAVHEAAQTPGAAGRPQGDGPPTAIDPSGPPARARVTIPDRRYFRIGDVADLLGVKPHVLRYWESEFLEVRPPKSRKGHRLYRRRDVELLAAIRRLVHEERYTVAGARERLKALLEEGTVAEYARPEGEERTRRLLELRDGLRELVAFVARREADLDAEE